jgi:hypothetical protein
MPYLQEGTGIEGKEEEEAGFIHAVAHAEWDKYCFPLYFVKYLPSHTSFRLAIQKLVE